MYCYYKEQLFNFNFLDDDSDASTMGSEDADFNMLTDINKVEGITIYKYIVYFLVSSFNSQKTTK